MHACTYSRDCPRSPIYVGMKGQSAQTYWSSIIFFPLNTVSGSALYPPVLGLECLGGRVTLSWQDNPKNPSWGTRVYYTAGGCLFQNETLHLVRTYAKWMFSPEYCSWGIELTFDPDVHCATWIMFCSHQKTHTTLQLSLVFWVLGLRVHLKQQ